MCELANKVSYENSTIVNDYSELSLSAPAKKPREAHAKLAKTHRESSLMPLRALRLCRGRYWRYPDTFTDMVVFCI